MADRKIVFFKNYIKSQIASLRDSLGEARYNLYLATVDSIEDYEELKELAELELQIEYAKLLCMLLLMKLTLGHPTGFL